MTSHFAVLASLGLALLLSPETLVLGLVIASDRKAPKLAAWAYALGGLVGISFALAVGMILSPAPLSAAASTVASAVAAHRWRRFIVHAVIAAALLAIGVHRAFNAFEDTPIPDEKETRGSRFWKGFAARFPSLAHLLDPASDLPHAQIGLRGALAGFAVCGLHPKIFPVAIAAGHQIEDMPQQQRLVGALLFVLVGAGATLVPPLLETIRPGSAGAAKAAIERLMEVYGRLAIALLLVGVGLHMARRAWELYPG